MPQTARRLPETQPVQLPRAESHWAGELHGEVGAMHRAIEERLLATGDRLAVVPLPARPGQALAAALSRLTGWAALGGGFAATLLLLAR